MNLSVPLKHFLLRFSAGSLYSGKYKGFGKKFKLEFNELSFTNQIRNNVLPL